MSPTPRSYSRISRFSLLAILLLAAGSFLGSVLADGKDAEAAPEDQLWTFGRVLSLVEDQYVGPLESDELIEDAIAGLLRKLDPHSSYLTREAFSEMRDEQRGKFSGLGIQITKRGPDKPLTIIAPIDGTPASRAGLLSGDVISEIEGEPTIELTVTDAVRLLKGPKGSQVTVTIERPGDREPFQVTLERDDIPIESVRVAHMVDDQVGYIRIANFTSTTAEELDLHVGELKEQGMTRLLLDLRGNPGGLLDQAVQVSERFVEAGELVVYTRGRIHGSNQDYVAKRNVERIDLPLVLLVDRSSASASEIVSGAVQDHDRGLIVGETTFGKGLVQRVIPLRQSGGALAVTTAKYYTPKGRLIQRDYTDIDEYYLNRDDEDTEALTDDEREVFYTDSGRKVYGGGGIRPDYIVKTASTPRLLFRLLRENHIFNFSVRYSNAHPELQRGFEITDALYAEFRSFLDDRGFEGEGDELTEHRDLIALRLESQINRLRWGKEAESLVLMGGDPQVQEALSVFDEAEELAGRSKSERNDLLRAELERERDAQDESASN